MSSSPSANPAQGAAARDRGVPRLSDVTIQVLVMLGLLVLLVCVTGAFDPNFFGPFTLRGVARDAAILSLIDSLAH